MVRPRLLALSLVVLAGLVLGGAVLGPWPRHDRHLERLRELGLPIYCGGGKGPYVALTFDDGPTTLTPQLLQVLADNQARATFFEIGSKAARSPDLVKAEAGAGAVGDHTWSHVSLPGLGRRRVTDEIDKAKRAIEQGSRARVQLFRPPFGVSDGVVRDVSRGLGLLQVLWNVDSGDVSGGSTTPRAHEIARNLAERVRPGAIVLLHEDEAMPRAIEALQIFLPELRRRGLKAVTVADLLRLDPPDVGAIENGPPACTSTWRP